MTSTSSTSRAREVALRIAIAAACCVGIAYSLGLARADYLFRQDTEASVRAAVSLEPDAWQYYMRLAQLDQTHARDLLETSLRLNRFDAQADVELGLQYEANGDLARAERQLREAYNVDHTYLPRWTLANYYFRRGNMPVFWIWARSAASMPADDIGALLDLCWRASPDAHTLTANLLNEKPEMLRQYIRFLAGKNQQDEIAIVAPHLVRAGNRVSDGPLLLAAVNQMILANDGEAANQLWRLLIQRGWVIADSGWPNNAGFEREPLAVAFDWWLPEYGGLHSWPGASGLQTEFSGSEPENCTIAAQTVYLTAGSYTLDYAYRTSEIAAAAGLRWQVIEGKTNAVLAESADLSSDELTHGNLAFTIPPGSTLIRLQLVYKRTLGTPHIAGSLDLVSTQIRAES